MDETKRKAYHEAAHAVAALRFGWRLNYVSIASPTTKGWWPQGGASPNQEVIVALAGYVAETIVYPGSEKCAREAAKDDFDDAAELIQKLDDQDLGSWISRTRSFVEYNWKAISALAKALLQNGTLFPGKIKDVVRTADLGEAGD